MTIDQTPAEDAAGIDVTDTGGRRRFIRRTAALAVAGSPLLASGQALADCDQGDRTAEGKQAQASSSDSDQGASADPAGCARRPAPVISRVEPSDDPAVPLRIDTVKG